MKIKSAIVTLRVQGTDTKLEYPPMKVKDLAHELINLSQPQLDIVVSDGTIERFKNEAKKDYITSNTFNDFDAYLELYVRLKVDTYIRLEHAKHSYNSMVLEYSKLINELTLKAK